MTFSLICPNGRLDFTHLQLLKNQAIIKDSLLEEPFLPGTRLSGMKEFTLTFNIAVANRLVPVIRRGVVYKTDDLESDTEFIELLQHLSGMNLILKNLAKCLKNGCMDPMGTYMPGIRIFDCNSIPYDDIASQRLRNEIIKTITPSLQKMVSKTVAEMVGHHVDQKQIICTFNLGTTSGHEQYPMLPIKVTCNYWTDSRSYSVGYDGSNYVITDSDGLILNADGQFVKQPAEILQ